MVNFLSHSRQTARENWGIIMSKSLKFKVILLCSAVLFSIAGSGISIASTIRLTDSATTLGPGIVQIIDQDNVFIPDTNVGPTADSISASGSNTTVVNGQTQISEANASASLDSITGVSKVYASTNYNDGYYAASHASAIASVSETFLAVGTGTITAFMAVSGAYDLATQSRIFPADGSVSTGDLSFQISAFLSVSMGSSAGTDILYDPMNDCIPVACPTKSGSISDTLIANLLVPNGTSVTIFSQLVAQIINGEGFIDLSHTAYLLITTSPGLTLIPNDARFLSNPAFGASPVPLPASLPLLAAGVASLGFTGWRKRRQAVA